MTEPTTIRSILAIGVNGVRAQITQINGGDVEDSLRGQYSLKLQANEYQQAVNLAKEGKWEEAKAVLDPKFDYSTLITKG